MAHENKKPENVRKVTRQSWKMDKPLQIVHNAWIAIYTIIKIAAASIATVLLIVAVCAVVFVGMLGAYLEGDIMPQAGVQIESFDLNQNSYAYYIDKEGNPQRLQKIYADTDSEWAEIDEIPQALIDAAVSIEDKRFYQHQGVDWFTTVKACINMFIGSGDQFGGSSITQQLIKNMLLTEDEGADDVTVQRKILEIFRATEFERRYDKDVVMEYYLNYIFLGNRCTGVKAAAAKYFGKELEFLTPAECACLISITNNPSKFNPYRTNLDSEGKTGMEQNKLRMTNTLWVMRNEGYLTEEEYQQALAQEIVLKDGIDEMDKVADCAVESCGYHGKVGTFEKKDDGIFYCPVCGAATTIGKDASQEVYSWFMDTVLEDVAQAFAQRDGVEWNGNTKDLYKKLVAQGGYHIFTTLDYTVQSAVDKIYKNLDEIPKTRSVQQLQSGIVVIDNKSGDIVAMAGGVGDQKGFDDWNCATDAKLQPGSSLKPLSIYAPAFEMGVITPATVVKDMPFRYVEVEQEPDAPPRDPNAEIPVNPFPKNDNKKYSYSRTILSGVEDSINGVAVNTLDKIGLTYGFQFAKDKFRLSGLVERYVNSAGTVFSDIDWSPLAMGAPTIGITVRDMAAAYATFANDGAYRTARTFLKVYDVDGEVILENGQTTEQILSHEAVSYMNYCLDTAVDSGTGDEADINGHDVAGKTGTTASKKDRWFCGYTDYYTAAIWCGYNTPEEIKMVNGGNPAAQLFKKVMQPLHRGLQRVPLFDETEFVSVQVCLDSGRLATASCHADVRGGRVTQSVVHADDVPTAICDKHVAVECCESGEGAANAYCKNFAAANQITLTTKSLVKLTKDEVDAIVKACKHGLNAAYLNDSYVYYVDENGNPVPFYGMQSTINAGFSEPYKVCTKHTKASWESYLSNHPGYQPEETTASQPSESE